MKKENKRVTKMDFKNSSMVVSEGRLIIIEYDKEDCIVGEYDLIEELENSEGFLNEIGFNISFTRNAIE